MMKAGMMAVGLACMVATGMAGAQGASDVDAVAAEIRASNPDIRKLCQGGPDAIRKAATEAVMKLMGEGKVKGNPQEVGGAAGQRIGQECRR